MTQDLSNSSLKAGSYVGLDKAHNPFHAWTCALMLAMPFLATPQ